MVRGPFAGHYSPTGIGNRIAFGGKRFVLASSTATFSEWKGSDVRRDDLLNSDLLSEIVLLGSAMLLVATLVAIVVMAFTPAARQV